MVAGLITLAVLASLLLVQAGREPPEIPKGYTARGDRARSGVIATQAVTTPGTTAWRVPLSLPDLLPRQVEVHAGQDTAYVVDVGGDTGVTAHDTRTGAVRWVRRDLAVADDARVRVGERLFVTLRDGRGVALGPDGAIEWTAPQREIRDPTVANGLLVQRRGTVLEVHDPERGTPLWSRDLADDGIGPQRVLSDGPAGHLAVIGNRPVDIALGERPELELPQVVLLDASTGFPRVRIDLPQGLAWFQQPVAVDSQVVAAADVADLYLWDANNGTQLAVVPHLLGDRPLEVEAARGLVLLHSATTLAAFDAGGRRVWARRLTPPVDVEPRGELTALIGPSRTTLLSTATGEVVGGQPVAAARRFGPLGPEGTAYTLDPDGTLTAYGATGISWAVPTTVPSVSAPAVADDLVAVATGTGVLALRAEDGSRRWEHRASTSDSGRAGELQTPVIVDRAVIVSPPRSAPEDAGGVYALDRDTGILRWSRLTDRPAPRGPLTLDRDLVLLPVADELHGHALQSGRRAFAAPAGGQRGPIAAGDATLVTATPQELLLPSRPVFVVGVRRADRVLRWRTQVPACSAPIVTGDLAVIPTTDEIIALDLTTGDLVWRTPAAASCTELAATRGLVVTTTSDHRVLAFATADGASQWEVDLGGVPAVAPVIAGDEVLVARMDGVLEALALMTGEPRWTAALAGVPASPPVAVGDTLLVILRDGTLQALR